MKAYPKSFPEGKDLKNAQRPLWFLLQDMGKKIDVNAFAMETYWQDVAYHFASDELYLVCALA